MKPDSVSCPPLRIGSFALDIQAGELHHNGSRIKLQEQPRQVLAMLLERPGEVVTREEFRRQLWPDHTFVDFDHGLNKAINKLRDALKDNADNPQYIETLPRRGYRFIAPVEAVGTMPSSRNGGSSLKIRVVEIPPRQQAVPPRERWIWPLAAAMWLMVAGAAFVYFRTRPLRPPGAFDLISLTRLTTSGKVNEAAVAPDGRSVAYIEEDFGKRSIWLRQVTTASSVRIVPPAPGYQGLSFSPDGNYLYYAQFVKEKFIGILYRVPVLGGEPRTWVQDVDSAVTFSPYGARMAFLRGNLPENEDQLIVANADGTGEKELAGRKNPGFLGPSVSWSPDGKIVAVPAGRNYFQATVIGVKEDGSEIPLTSRTWAQLGGVVWLTDGSGLIITAAEHTWGSSQIWLLEYPSGRVHRITNDLDDYGNVSLTADSSALVTTQGTRVSNMWIAPAGAPSQARQVTTARNDNIASLAWTPDGKIVYASNASGGPDLWIMEADGSNSRQLTTESSVDVQPTVSPDGRYVVFVSDRTGIPHIWRIDADGSNPRQLTNAAGELTPQCSPDGKWVVYTTNDPTLTVWKVPMDGGVSVELTEKFSQRATLSPDGKRLACVYLDDPSKPWKLAIMAAEGGPPAKLFDISHGAWRAGIRWTPDGGAIAYALEAGGVSNIWLQPLEGGPPEQLTHFNSDLIFDFSWSRDGKQLALARGNVSNDMVLIKNFH